MNTLNKNETILAVCKAIKNANGRALLVGGAVRDMAIGHFPKDFDFEIFGLYPDEYLPILEQFGRIEHRGLGKFPTYGLQMDGLDLEFASPRRDNKVGPKHSDYTVQIDPFMSYRDAARRRDYTINAMAHDPLTGERFDSFGGAKDLQNGLLRATDPQHFGEDALRVLRGMQFAGRFGMAAFKTTAELCQSLHSEYQYIDKSARWCEWEKWASKSIKPANGLWFLFDTKWLPPELMALFGLEQDRIWHPEGDAWSHTLYTVNAMVNLCNEKNITGHQRLVRIFAALCHDMGKPFTTEKGEDGRIRSIGHEKAGVEPTRSFLESIGCPEAIIEQVVSLVAEHMNYKGALASKKALRKLAHRLYPATIRQLCDVVWADHAGRPPLPPDREDVLAELLKRAEADGCADDVPEVVKGRHLLEAGWTPGIHMGKGLQACYQAWLNARFDTPEEGVKYAGKAK